MELDNGTRPMGQDDKIYTTSKYDQRGVLT